VAIEIIRPDTHIDFLSKWRVCAVLSVVVILLSLLAIPLRGFRLGLDFAGGHEIQVRFTEEVPADEGVVRRQLAPLGLPDLTVVRFGDEGQRDFLVRFGGEQGAEGEIALGVQSALEEGVGPVVLERVGFVGPKVGRELQRAAFKSIGLASLLILAYIAFRFSPRFAPGAVVALVHDISITAGVFVLLGYEFDLTVLAALLAILGYSLNDTIIVYDRIRENMERHTKYDLQEVLNRSVNQTLSRTILTSGSTMLAVLALLFLGGPIIRPFALAMVVGIAVGTYSSIYVAAPTLLFLERYWKSGGGGSAAPARRPQKSSKAARA